MVRLEFSFDCKVFAFNFRVGSKPCACNIRPTTQIAPSAKQDFGNNGATQISDTIILTSSELLDSRKDKTAGLPPAKSNLDSVIDPLLLKSSRLSDTTNRKTPGLLSPKNLSGTQMIINAGEYLGTKPSQSPPESTANACAHKDAGNSSNDSEQGAIIARSRGFLQLPPEILDVFFRELLVNPKTVCQAHKLIGTEQVMESQCPRNKGLEPAILRTCRSIYLQALPILYGHNAFRFDSGESLTEFAHKGLNGQFAFQKARYGRLTMIRYVVIQLGYTGRHRTRDRNTLWRHWDSTLTPDDYRDTVGFPSLLGIGLDFSDWELGSSDEHEINVSLVL